MFPGPDPDSSNRHRLSTPRLTLEPPKPSDVDSLFALVGGPDRRRICAGLLWDGPDDPAEIRGWVEKHARGTYSETGYAWVIHHGDEVAGSVGLRPHHFPGRALVGYWLGVRHWRRGIMSEALAAVLDAAFGDWRLGKVEAEVFAHNLAGIRLVESMGLTREAYLRRAVLKGGEWIDETVYGILAEEWDLRR
jgi:[ribosomal protein S5]-alanine N-acetyltransferase